MTSSYTIALIWRNTNNNFKPAMREKGQREMYFCLAVTWQLIKDGRAGSSFGNVTGSGSKILETLVKNMSDDRMERNKTKLQSSERIDEVPTYEYVRKNLISIHPVFQWIYTFYSYIKWLFDYNIDIIYMKFRRKVLVKLSIYM